MSRFVPGYEMKTVGAPLDMTDTRYNLFRTGAFAGVSYAW